MYIIHSIMHISKAEILAHVNIDFIDIQANF